MKLLMVKFAPIIILVAIVVMGLLTYNHKKYFEWIRKHWFFKKSFYNSVSFAALLASFAFLLFSLMDVRGPQEHMEVTVPDQKTIVMIDTSASMLVEDVKPSRFKRALFMAKHFIKKAVGHQVAIVLFSNIQKRIVPFTDDIDLLDARISGLETLDISRGGSNIAQAIQESLQYFKSSTPDNGETFGNILIFSDSEESSAPFDVKIPKRINVAFVGVGTLNGGKVPLRGRNERFRGYKRYGGKDVISKLNENYIKSLGTKIPAYRYWVASSYTIYTDEIINFFEKSFLEDFESAHQTVVRPVWSHYIASVGIAFYILSIIFSQFRSFALIFLLMALGWNDGGVARADISADLENLREGGLDKARRLKLAEKFLKKGETENALKLYRENVGELEEADFFTLSNYAVALFQSGGIEEGVKIYNYLYRNAPLGEREKDALRNNLLKALDEEEKRQKQEKKQDGDKGQEDKKDSGEEEKSDESGEEKDNNDGGGEGSEKGKDEEGEQREKKGGGKEGEEEDEKKSDNKNDQKNQDSSSQQKKDLTGREALMEKKKNVEKQRKLVKIPETIKSIMDKERSLQDRAFDTGTYDKKRDRRVKDW